MPEVSETEQPAAEQVHPTREEEVARAKARIVAISDSAWVSAKLFLMGELDDQGIYERFFQISEVACDALRILDGELHHSVSVPL